MNEQAKNTSPVMQMLKLVVMLVLVLIALKIALAILKLLLPLIIVALIVAGGVYMYNKLQPENASS